MSNEIQSIDYIAPKYSKDYSEDSFWDKIIGCVKCAGLELMQIFCCMVQDGRSC